MLKGLENRQIESGVQKSMGKQEKYFKIYEQIYETPNISVHRIAGNTGMARNTVVKLMEEMYSNHILFPPFLAVKPASNYAEYIHFLEFGGIDSVLPRLKRHPYVKSYIQCKGAWNVLVAASQLICFKDVAEDFCIPLYQRKRGLTITPKCSFEGSFEVTGERVEVKGKPDLEIEWNENEWMLYMLFKENMRRTVTPFLKEKKVCYKDYVTWKENLHECCSVHTLFYPLGFYNYVHWFFLMETNIGISSIFEEWSCSCIFVEVDPFVLAHISVPVHKEEKLQRLSQYLWNDSEITGFCADPLYKSQSRTYSESQFGTKRR